MTRHILDIPKARRTASRLRRFLLLDRRSGAPDLHPVLARLPRQRNAAHKADVFRRIDRRGAQL